MRVYFKELNKNYPLIKRFKLSLIIFLIFIVLDILNLPTTILNEQNFILGVILAIGALILIILISIENGVMDEIKIASINYSDMFISILGWSMVLDSTIPI